MFGRFFKRIDHGSAVIRELMEKHSESSAANAEAHKRLISACDAKKIQTQDRKLRVVK